MCAGFSSRCVCLDVCECVHIKCIWMSVLLIPTVGGADCEEVRGGERRETERERDRSGKRVRVSQHAAG